MTKTEEINQLVNKLATMDEEDFKALAGAIRKVEWAKKLSIFESACRIQGQCEQALKTK